MRPTVTRGPVVSYTAVSPLPVEDGRSVLCCAISQVTLGGRYPHRALWSPEVPQPIPMKITAAASRGLKPAIIHKVRKRRHPALR